MKKAVILIVLLGMVGFAVYDFVDQPDDSASPDTDEAKESSSVNGKATEPSTADKSEATTADPTVGLEMGNIAPDFQLQTLAGKTVKLSDYRGQRVMVNFWATWCPPCRAEMPDMEKFYQNEDIVILAINLTQTEKSLQQVQDFVNEFQVTFPILLDKQIEVATNYGIRPIPTSFMIDPNGIIQFKAFGAMSYERMVQEFEKMK
ncbi:alkyl hydroperoxide reductase [Virgibacillus phasianinus]|uniref:Alkyl hydroperoxide reductase n=1 Tax=Virgibacillus phasianinus TaxID=2017483 RepID=A0A220U8H5_9BACI|nr:redoxin domain-containing protein [Virgibacillus phasianinus]ASK64033.1 alkyl hydroperoxide reductase [Virgibacillus phasianinus]